MPALAKATPAPLKGEGLRYVSVEVPSQRRETRIVKNATPEEIARELADWIKA
jgi:electron transfer flavoprotein beta subunit